ncbi:MAG TPA: hypothetical protein VMV79_00950 [Alphaproteobacteria bacterium]|nr:hypothetical protein [Alphaproteobacteria bacterium]
MKSRTPRLRAVGIDPAEILHEAKPLHRRDRQHRTKGDFIMNIGQRNRITAGAVAVAAALLLPAGAQAAGPGGYGASQTTTFGANVFTGGSNLTVAPFAHVANTPGGGTFEQGAFVGIGKLTGGSNAYIGSTLDMGPPASGKSGGFAASQDTGYTGNVISGGSGLQVVPYSSIALGRYGGTFSQNTGVAVGAVRGGSQVFIGSGLDLGPAVK